MDKKKFYLIGNPVSHSLSPVMQQLFFNFYKIDGQYEALCVNSDYLQATLLSLKNNGTNGINVTLPFKESVFKYLDEISDEASAIGCVNTIKFSNGTLKGYNTDIIGFEKSLPISITDENVVMLGAGGSARAILFALGRLKCKQISIFNRTFSKAKSLVNEFRKKYPELILRGHAMDNLVLEKALKNSVLLINTTSVGMKSYNPHLSLVKPEYLHKNLFVYDIVYNPLETLLLRHAKRNGLDYMNGIDMLIYQGLESLKIWMGTELPFASSLITKTREVLIQEIISHG